MRGPTRCAIRLLTMVVAICCYHAIYSKYGLKPAMLALLSSVCCGIYTEL